MINKYHSKRLKFLVLEFLCHCFLLKPDNKLYAYFPRVIIMTQLMYQLEHKYFTMGTHIHTHILTSGSY